MEISISAQKIKKFFSPGNLKKIGLSFLAEKSGKVVFVIAIILFAYCVYIWYGCIYASEWNAAKKQAYIAKKGQSVSFNQSGFEAIQKEFSDRAQALGQISDNIPDIFQLKQ